MKVTLIPVVDNQWFAFIKCSDHEGWDSPEAVLKFLEGGQFPSSGDVVDRNPALAICMAALKTMLRPTNRTCNNRLKMKRFKTEQKLNSIWGLKKPNRS